MSEPRNLRATVAGHCVALLLSVAMASHAKDASGVGLTLQGTVVDAATGLPVAGADVRHLSVVVRYAPTADESQPGWSATTNDEGHFTLADLPCRDVYLQVSAAGYTVSRSIRVPTDSSRLEVRLGQGTTIEGALSLESGGPATGKVWLSPAGRPWQWTTKEVDPSGRFRFEHVTPGSYTVTVTSSSGIAERRDVRVAEGDHVAIEFSLVQLGHVTGWISGLVDGEYEVEVQLGFRGTSRSFAVTVSGETVSDVRLGPYSIAGTIGPGFRHNVVQARLVEPGDEPVIHRVLVEGNGTYRFDGLDQGDYLVSHSSPYFGEIVEVRIFDASVEGLDFDPGFRDGQTVPVVDVETKQPVESISCAIEEGPWAGISIGFGSDRRRWLPAALVDTDMTCTSRGYEPLPVRWDGEPFSLELVPTETG